MRLRFACVTVFAEIKCCIIYIFQPDLEFWARLRFLLVFQWNWTTTTKTTAMAVVGALFIISQVSVCVDDFIMRIIGVYVKRISIKKYWMLSAQTTWLQHSYCSISMTFQGIWIFSMVSSKFVWIFCCKREKQKMKIKMKIWAHRLRNCIVYQSHPGWLIEIW